MSCDRERPLGAPCPHPVGSVEKIEVLRQRVELGQSLWHPLDCPLHVPDGESGAWEESESDPWVDEMLASSPLLLSVFSAARLTEAVPQLRAA